MFGNLPTGTFAPKKVDPKDIPEPTPVTLPRYQPVVPEDGAVQEPNSLSDLLKHTGRSDGSLLGPSGLQAIGVSLSLDASIKELVPDESYVPDFAQWEHLSQDEARERNQSTRRPLRNGSLSPGCQTYLERKKELCHTNQDSFRTVRRIPAPKGKQQARLGNAYEFFRCLETLTTFWDDPTQPSDLPPSPEPAPTEVGESSREGSPGNSAEGDGSKVYRTASGSSTPPEFRQSLLSAFIKLVSYDFGCNVSMSRTEPRLNLCSPHGSPSPRKSYIPSHCSFIFQSPTTRETARAGIVYGPVAAVSARATTDFSSPSAEAAQSLDLAREMVAALITAQHRAREGKTETRFGEGEWWTRKPRWGGGTGGPIGREIDRDAVQGDKDARPSDGEGMPIRMAKKPRKNMSIYESYRTVRPPAPTWDSKARYEAAGKVKGADYDDIFVVSCLFHHISILRVRVPTRLLDVLDGSPEADPSTRSFGGVPAWRSPWFDVFDMDQRMEAVRYMWSVMAYQMRKDTSRPDVPMADS